MPDASTVTIADSRTVTSAFAVLTVAW